MVAYIKGTLEYSKEDHIVVDNNGLGYEIKIPLSILSELPPIGESIKVYTYLYVREDAMLLYGFISEDDLNVFKLLLTVNGIGPKGALAILSSLSPDALRLAVVTGDDQIIAKAPGIGKKTAQRLIIDLKDKLKPTNLDDLVNKDRLDSANIGLGENDIMNEAVAALVSLGYTNSEAIKATKGLKELNTVEEILKHALKQLARL